MTAPTDIRPGNVEALLRSWSVATEDRDSGPLCLDLAEVNRVERLAGGVLSNALLGTLGATPLEIRIPDHRSLDWVWASGLAFAFANRTGDTKFDGNGHDLSDLKAWRQRWRPGMETTWREMLTVTQDELFRPAELGETEIVPDLFGPTFAAFIDPHLNRFDDGGTHPITTVLWPWLDRLLPGPVGSLSSRERRRFIGGVGRFVTETVLNIAQHAAGHGSPVRSLAQVAVTRGGTGVRLYLSVQDTGPGIVATARPKIDREQAATLSDEDLVRALFAGELPPWGRSRGLGLPYVAGMSIERKGKLLASTRTTRLYSSLSGDLVAEPSDFDLQGTVVALMLPLPTP